MSKAALNKRKNAIYSNAREKKNMATLMFTRTAPWRLWVRTPASTPLPALPNKVTILSISVYNRRVIRTDVWMESAFCGPLGDLFCLSCTLPRFGVWRLIWTKKKKKKHEKKKKEGGNNRKAYLRPAHRFGLFWSVCFVGEIGFLGEFNWRLFPRVADCWYFMYNIKYILHWTLASRTEI